MDQSIGNKGRYEYPATKANMYKAGVWAKGLSSIYMFLVVVVLFFSYGSMVVMCDGGVEIQR
jgi:hypothetical protein